MPDRSRADRREPEADGPPRRRPRTGQDPLPPAREQLPLPRRRRQAHIDPQLHTPGGTGDGTPFAPFTDGGPGPAPDSNRDLPAEFLEGSRQARRETRRRGRRAE
jgi:hypothetical protein